MTKRCDDALERAKIAEDRLATLEKSQVRDSALQTQKIGYLERDLSQAQSQLQQSEEQIVQLKEKLDKMTTEKEQLRVLIEQQKKTIVDECNELKAVEIAKLTKDYEAKIEAKNEQILADMDRKANEEKEKQMRNEQYESQ